MANSKYFIWRNIYEFSSIEDYLQFCRMILNNENLMEKYIKQEKRQIEIKNVQNF